MYRDPIIQKWLEDPKFKALPNEVKEQKIHNYLSSKQEEEPSPKQTDSVNLDDYDIGSISSKYESGGRGASAIGNITQMYYGTYQIIPDNIPSFVENYVKPVSEEAYNLLSPHVGTAAQEGGEFARNWLEVAKEGVLDEAEKKYIYETHYLPQLKKLGPELAEVVEGSKALQSIVWSTAVQHGPNTNVILKAAEASDGTVEDLIEKIYDIRKERFPRVKEKDPKVWQNMMEGRFSPEGEIKDVMTLLEQERALSDRRAKKGTKKVEDLDEDKPYLKYLSTPKEAFPYEAPAEEYEMYAAPGVEAVEREPETGKLVTHETLNLLKKEGEEDFLWYTPDEGQKTEPVLPTVQSVEKFEKDPNIAKAQQDPLYLKLKPEVLEKKVQNYFLKQIVDDDFWELSEDKRTEIALNFFKTNLPLPAPERSPIEELVTGVRVAGLAMQSNFHSWKALHSEDVEDKIENYIKAAEIHEKLSDRKYALQSPDILEVRTFKDALNWGVGTLPQVASSMGSIIAGGLAGSVAGSLAGSAFFPGVGTGVGGTLGFLSGSYISGHQLYAADIFFSLVSQGVPFEDAKKYAEQYSHGASAASLMVPGALYMGIKGHFGKQWMKSRLNAALKTVPITTPAEGVAEFIAQQFVMNAQEKALGEEIPSEQRWREGINAASAGGLMGFVSGMTGGAFLKRGTRAQMVDGFLTEMDQLATHPDILSEAISQLEKVPNPNKDTQALIKYLRKQHEGVSNRSLDRQEKLIGQKVAEVTGREPGDNIQRAQHLLTKGDLTTEEALELTAIYANNPIYRISQKGKLGYPLTPQEIQFGLEKGILSEEEVITPPSPPTTTAQLSTAEQLRAISEAEGQQDFLPDVTIKEVNKKKFAEIDRLKKIKERSPEEQEVLDFLRQTKDLNRIADFFNNRLIESDAPLSQQIREELEHRASINSIDTKGLSDEQIRQAIINAEDKGVEPKFKRKEPAPKTIPIRKLTEKESNDGTTKAEVLGQRLSKDSPVHHTEIDNLSGILEEGLNPGSAIDGTPTLEWGGLTVILDASNVGEGKRINHNDYYTSAKKGTPKWAIINLDNLTSKEAQARARDKIKALQAKHPNVNFYFIYENKGYKDTPPEIKLPTTKRVEKKPKKPVQKSLVEKTLNEVKKLYPALKNTKVVQKESELPQGIQRSLKQRDLQGKVYGVAYEDTIYIIANNITSEQASNFTVIDSIVRHEGRHILFQKILGGVKAANEFFTKAAVVLKTDVQNYLNEHQLEDTLKNRREAAEEILADMAKRGKIHNLVDKLLSKLLEWIRKIPQFKDVSLTQAELRKLIADADASMTTGFNEIQESNLYIYSPKFMRFVGTSVAEQMKESGALQRALKLKREGLTPREIWNQTRWFEITPNDWNFFLPDKPIVFEDRFLQLIKSEASSKYAPLFSLEGVIKDIDTYEIFKLYPTLKNASVQIKYKEPPIPGYRLVIPGSFSPSGYGIITLYLPKPSWIQKLSPKHLNSRVLKYIKSTLVHELQHGIQHEEYRRSNFPGYIGVKSTGSNVNVARRYLELEPISTGVSIYSYYKDIERHLHDLLQTTPIFALKELLPQATEGQLLDFNYLLQNIHLIKESIAKDGTVLGYQSNIIKTLNSLDTLNQATEWWNVIQSRIENEMVSLMEEDQAQGRPILSEDEYVAKIVESYAFPLYAQTSGEVISRLSGAIEKSYNETQPLNYKKEKDHYVIYNEETEKVIGRAKSLKDVKKYLEQEINKQFNLSNRYPGDLIVKNILSGENLLLSITTQEGRYVEGEAVTKQEAFSNVDEALEGTLIPGDILPETDVAIGLSHTKVDSFSMMEDKNNHGLPIPPDHDSPVIGANESLKHGEFKTGWIKTIFSSVSDVFRDIKEPWANDFANKVDNYYNSLEQRLGEVNAPFHEVMKTIYKPLAFGGKGKDSYFKDFSDYFRHMDWGRTELAEQIYKEALPETRTLIDQAKKTFDEIGDKNLTVKTPEGKPLMVRVNDMYVWDQEGQQWLEREKANHIISELKENTIYKGGWRPIRKIKKGIYFPRKMRSEIVRLKANPELDPGLYETVIDALENMKDSKGNLRFSDRAAAEKWFKSTAFNEVYLNDYHANIEKSRRDPLPEIFYEYSWATASDYFYAWAKRVAQVETYGQDVAGRGDYFDRTLSKISDGDVRDYAIMVRDAIYEAKTIDKTTKYVGTANMIATASQLANIATATRNLIGGTALNVVSMGPGRTIKALSELISDYREIMAEGVRLGILGKDIMNLFNDNDSRDYHTKYAKFNDRVSRFASWSMSRSLYKYTENIIRATAMVSAKNYLTESLHNINKNGMKNKKAIQFIAWTKRHNLNSTKLILEDGVGKETAKMLRKSVNIPQGSYRIDMTPMFVDTKWGRFILKYQKFSTQVSRLFYMEYFKPLMDSIKNPQYDGHAAHEMARTIGFVGTGIFGGTLDAMIRMYIFGYMDKGPDPDDLLYQISQDKEASLKVAWLLDRAMNSLINSGFLGIASTPIQGMTNLVNQRSVANPLDPPGVAVVTHLGQFLSKLVQTKGDMGYRDVVNSADQLWAMFRAYRRAGLTTLEAVGFEWKEVQYHSARKEQMYVRKIISRWMRDSGYEIKRPKFEGVYRTPQSKFNQQVYEAIATGRPERARIIIKEYLKGKTKSEGDAIKRSLAQSVRNRQPMTFGGTQNAKLEKEFKGWLNQDNLPDHSKAKILRVQKEYISNAKKAGVL